jgi:2-iminobutanoate/2-iminopropanoate deaminase
MIKQVIIPEGGAKPLAPYSPGIRAGSLVFTSGQIGLDPETGILVSGGVKAETRQALENLSKILDSAGSSLDQVVKVTLYINEIDDYGLINEVYGNFFPENPPARAIIQGDLPAGAHVEVDCIALTIG